MAWCTEWREGVCRPRKIRKGEGLSPDAGRPIETGHLALAWAVVRNAQAGVCSPLARRMHDAIERVWARHR